MRMDGSAKQEISRQGGRAFVERNGANIDGSASGQMGDAIFMIAIKCRVDGDGLEEIQFYQKSIL